MVCKEEGSGRTCKEIAGDEKDIKGNLMVNDQWAFQMGSNYVKTM